MAKHSLAITVAATFLASNLCVGRAMSAAPQTAPTSKPAELAGKFLLEIQEIAKIDAPGADGFVSALAAVLKKHAFPVPEAILKAKPSAALPKLTEKQFESYSSQTVTNLLDHISYAKRGTVGPVEGALRIDLLEAFCRYAPRMDLRLQAADRILVFAFPGEEERLSPALMVDPRRAVEVAKTAVTESLAAARDSRDTFSMQTLVGIGLARVATRMVGIDLMNLTDPTRESLEKARKQWDEQFAALEKDAQDEPSKKVLVNIRKYLSEQITDAQVEAMLLPRQLKPIMEAFYKALEKRDREGLLAMLTPTTAAKLAKMDINAIVKDMFGDLPCQIRLISIGGLYTLGGQEGVSVPCNVLWVDDEGKEHTSHPEMHLIKINKEWRIGEK